MSMTPNDILEKKFSFSFKGYNPQEVDEFLDEVIEEFESMLNEQEKLNEQLAKCARDAVSLESVQQTLDDVVAKVKATSAQLMESAQQNAEYAMHVSQQKAQAVLDEAYQKADQILAQARQKAEQIVSSAYQQKQELVSQYNELTRTIAQIRARQRAELSAQLSLLSEERVPSIGEELLSDTRVGEKVTFIKDTNA